MRSARGSTKEYTTRQKHLRECFVVLEEGADAKQVEHDIVTMPNYFDEYDTTVHFISEEELKSAPQRDASWRVCHSQRHNRPRQQAHHGVFIKLDSNPEFTSSVLVCYARAAYRLAKQGRLRL